MKKLAMFLLLILLAAPFANSKAPNEAQFRSFEWYAYLNCGQDKGQCVPPS